MEADVSLHLWLLRHGEAHPHAPSDPERELTTRGEADAVRAGAWLLARPAPPTRVLASPYRRAQQTACAALPGLPLTTVAWATPDDDPRAALAELARLEGRIVLVSHQPLLGELIGLLLHGSVRAAVPLPTAGIAEIVFDSVTPGGGELRTLRYPPDFEVARQP